MENVLSTPISEIVSRIFVSPLPRTDLNGSTNLAASLLATTPVLLQEPNTLVVNNLLPVANQQQLLPPIIGEIAGVEKTATSGREKNVVNYSAAEHVKMLQIIRNNPNYFD